MAVKCNIHINAALILIQKHSKTLKGNILLHNEYQTKTKAAIHCQLDFTVFIMEY